MISSDCSSRDTCNGCNVKNVKNVMNVKNVKNVKNVRNNIKHDLIFRQETRVMAAL